MYCWYVFVRILDKNKEVKDTEESPLFLHIINSTQRLKLK